MNLAIWSFFGLISLVILSYISSLAFHILNDGFYNYFHLTAGILALFFFFAFTGSFIVSVILTELLGIVWEVFEWYQWKLILKKKKFKPKPADTRNDLILDFIGSLVGVFMLYFWF